MPTNFRDFLFDSISATANTTVLNRRLIIIPEAEYVETEYEIPINFNAGSPQVLDRNLNVIFKTDDSNQPRIKYLPINFFTSLTETIKDFKEININFSTALKYNMELSIKDVIFTGLDTLYEYGYIYGHGADTITEYSLKDFIFSGYYTLLKRYYFKIKLFFFNSKLNYSERYLLVFHGGTGSSQTTVTFNDLDGFSFKPFNINIINDIYLNEYYDFLDVIIDGIEYISNNVNYKTLSFIGNDNSISYNFRALYILWSNTLTNKFVLNWKYFVFSRNEYTSIKPLKFSAHRNIFTVGGVNDVILMFSLFDNDILSQRTITFINDYINYKSFIFNSGEPIITEIETPNGIIQVLTPLKYYDAFMTFNLSIPFVIFRTEANILFFIFSGNKIKNSEKSLVFTSSDFVYDVRDFYLGKTFFIFDYKQLFVGQDYTTYFIFNADDTGILDIKNFVVFVEGGLQFLTQNKTFIFSSSINYALIEPYTFEYEYTLVDYTNITDNDLRDVITDMPIFTPFYMKYGLNRTERDRLYIVNETTGVVYDNLVKLVIPIDIYPQGYSVEDIKLAVNSHIIIGKITALHEDENILNDLNDKIFNTEEIKITLKSFKHPQEKNIKDMLYEDFIPYAVYSLKVYCPISVFSYYDLQELYIHIEYFYPEVDKLRFYNIIFELKPKT